MTEPRAEPRKSDLSRYFKKSAVQGFFKLVGKQEVEVVDAEPTEDRVDHTAKGWTIGINESWDLLDYLHRAGHQKYTQYTMSDQVARIAQDPFMGRLAAPVEDARVDWLTSEFFDKPVFENHRKQVRVQLESLTENVKALPPVSGWQYVDSVKLTEVTMQLVGYMAFDLPMPALPPILQKFVEYFRDDVKKVRESGSPIDAAMLSSRMATFMGYMRQRPPQDFTLPPPPDAEKDEDSKEKSEHDKGDESGKKSDEKNEDKDEAEDKDESGKDEDKDEDDSESDESESEGKDKSDKSEDESESGDKKLDSPGDENEDESDESGDESEDDSEDEDEDEDESEGDTGDEGGLESEGGAGSDESDESDEDESESDESDDEADESDDEATSTGNLESDAPSSAPSDIPQDALDKIEKDAKDRIRNALLTMKKELTRIEKTDDALIAEMRAHPLDLGQVKIQQTSLGHEFVSFNIDQERIDYSTLRVKFDLEEERDHSQVRRAKSGLLTPETWRVVTGKMDVFNKPPLRKGRLVVMVDCSSSMGCPCDEHNDPDWGRARNDWRTATRNDPRTREDGVQSSWLAWQIVGAICQKFDDALVFAYSHNGSLPNSATVKYQQMTVVAPILPGYKPTCLVQGGRSPLYGGTPDCVALEYLYDRLMGDVSGAFAIVISDGEPSSPHENYSVDMNREHTVQLADMLSEAGLKYASIMIRTRDLNIYPAEYRIRVDSIGDLDQVGPMIGDIERNL